MRASEFLARNPQPGMSPRIQFAWAMLTYLQEEGRMPLTARIEYNSESEITLPEKWGYICEHGHLRYKHGSEEEETTPETETKDKQQMDSHIEESHRHEEDTTQTNMDMCQEKQETSGERIGVRRVRPTEYVTLLRFSPLLLLHPRFREGRRR